MKLSIFFLAALTTLHSFSNSQYTDVLQKSTKFYGAQRSGSTSNWLVSQYASPAPCFPKDGEKYTGSPDLSGGWHDAGDNIKFTTTTAWSAYALLKSYDAFPSAHKDLSNPSYGAANGIPDILDEVKWATDYLLKIHLDSSTLVSQIGDYRDHDQGLTCVTMTGQGTSKGGDPRTVWFGNSETDASQTKADVLGITSAALSLMATLYKPYDNAYSTTLIKHARQLYATAKARPGTTNEPANQTYYKDGSYKDDLACAAVELGRATSETAFLDEAISYSNEVGSHGWVVDWSQHIDYCRHSLAKAGKSADVKNHWGNAVSSYKSKISQAQYVKGLAFFSDWGSLRYALNSAFSAALYHQIYDDTAAKDFALSQIDYAMGTNEYKRSFIVGWGTNPPTRPHHKNAFGKDQWPSALSNPLYELTGALVGGPHTNDYTDGSLTSPPGYQDHMTDYITNEVTIDYNSGLVGIASFATYYTSSNDSDTTVSLQHQFPSLSIEQSNKTVEFQNPNNLKLNIQLFDSKGVVLQQKESNQKLILLEAVQNKGVYFLRISSTSKNSVQKIIL